MFELLLDMYLRGRISESYLKKAVRVKWITEEEMEQIKLAKVEADKIKYPIAHANIGKTKMINIISANLQNLLLISS